MAVTLIIGIDQTLNQLNYDSLQLTIKNGFGSRSSDYECTTLKKSDSRKLLKRSDSRKLCFQYENIIINFDESAADNQSNWKL